MTRFAFVSLLAFVHLACSQVPPPPDGGSGAGGAEAVGGSAGEAGIGGAGGEAGGGLASGGAGAGGMDACTSVVLTSVTDTERGDDAAGDTATGTVCSGGDCSAGLDEIDRWSASTCGGLHAVSLSWTNDDETSDLDWAAFGPEETLIEESATRTFADSLEEQTVVFEGRTPLTIEVRAYSTSGLLRAYTLTVSPSD